MIVHNGIVMSLSHTDQIIAGMLLFKTVWKNKRYEGMLVQASHDDWSFPKWASLRVIYKHHFIK